MATGLLWSGWSGVHMPLGARDFYRLRDNTDTGVTHSPIQCTLRVKQPGREVNHICPSSCEVKNERSYTFAPPILLVVWTGRYFSWPLIAYLAFGVLTCIFWLNNFKVTTYRRQKWSGLITHMWETRNYTKVLSGNLSMIVFQRLIQSWTP